MDEDKQIFNDALDVAETYRHELAVAQKRVAMLEEVLAGMLNIFDRGLPETSIGAGECAKARAALAGDAGGE
jgi:glutamyl-tRNA reductase